MINEGIKETSFDEVLHSQQNFKIIMDALSRPGEILKLQENNFTLFPLEFNPNLLTILKTLGDNNVSFHLSVEDKKDWENYIKTNTGMEISSVEAADFVVFCGKKYCEGFNNLKTGEVEFPENSCTAIIIVDKIRSNILEYKFIQMTGPGIKDLNRVCITGFDYKYIEEIREINANFPLGIDVILVDLKGNITCISRTTKLEVK